MQLKMKMVALAASMMAMGSAHADLISGTANNSGLALIAFNTSNGSYYIRDTGFLLNTFLPNNGAAITATNDAAIAGTVFDKTPSAGLTLNKGNTASFADAAFSTWYSAQTASDVRWGLQAWDSNGAVATNRNRQVGTILAGSTFTTPSNGTVGNSSATLNGFAYSGGLSTTGVLSGALSTLANSNFGGGSAANLGVIGQVSNLYYWTRNALATGATANEQQFANAAGAAQLTLAANGDFSYVLAPENLSPVPVPAAAWLLGSGLLAMGGVVRRRKAAAQLAAA